MKRLLAVDLETRCGVTGCEVKHCDHALRPETGRITIIGVTDGEIFKMYESAAAFGQSLLTEYKDCELMGQNFSFDIKFLVAAEPSLREPLLNQWKHDTQIAAHVSTNKIPDSWLAEYELHRKEQNKRLPPGYSHRAASLHSLKTLAPYFLAVEAFWEDPTNHESVAYLKKDCEYTLRLAHFLIKDLKSRAEYSFYEEFSMPVAKMLLETSLRGIQLDTEALAQVKLETEQKMQLAAAKLESMWASAHAEYASLQLAELRTKYDLKLVPQLAKATDKERVIKRYDDLYEKAAAKLEPRINYASPTQMVWLLRDYLGYDIVNAEGDETTGKSVLAKLAAQGAEDIKTYLEWKKQYKILTMYIPTYEELVAKDGAIHAAFNITGTRTGRLSSSAPNLQQLPSSLYRLFKPRDGYKFIVYDLGSIEAVLIALYTEDPNLFNIVTKGLSVHDYNTKYAVFPDEVDCPVEQVKEKFPKLRGIAKTIGFSVLYGAGANRVRVALDTAGYVVSDAEAREILGRLKQLYSESVKFHREITKSFEGKETIENLVGRPLIIPNKDECYMKGMNTLVQSSASDLLLLAALRAVGEFKKQGLDAHPLLFIHDCLMVEVKEANAPAADKIIRDSMLNFKLENSLGKLPLTIDGGIADKWLK
jgi:DNA polymerase I-like protein with 3'-5' exonuclease and polymerase domains